MDMVLKCSTCKQMKPVSEFHVCKVWTRGYAYKCKSCVREYKKRPEVRAQTNARERKYNAQGKTRLAKRNRRVRAIQKLGAKCACCGEAVIEFLAIDHIHELRGRGVKRNSGDAGDGTALQVLRSENPETTFRVLCHNCNLALGYYGYCPHQEQKNFLTR